VSKPINFNAIPTDTPVVAAKNVRKAAFLNPAYYSSQRADNQKPETLVNLVSYYDEYTDC
jgi:hypothetical protein